jgi:rsbT co-antagonist protein RsbR
MRMSDTKSLLASLIEKHHQALLTEWLQALGISRSATSGLHRDSGSGEHAQRFLDQLQQSLQGTRLEDIAAPVWASMRELLEEVSRARVAEGYSPSETATFVFSVKGPLFNLLRREIKGDSDMLADSIWLATKLIDLLGLYTIEAYSRTREELIGRQQQELLELSTPVVQLWDGILALPLIGTLDSARTQIVMESLLQRIVTSGAEMAIIDITGVPTVDTLVAQHLIKTISAARLMGADCILSGIRPQIAQTIVHLGLELNVISKATMADALRLALQRCGKTIIARTRPAPQGG